MPTNDLEEALEEREEIEEVERWTFALASDGDLRLNEGKTLDTTDGDAAAAQGLKVGIATRKGEDPLDPGFGLDVMRATNSIEDLRREIRKTLEYDDFDHDRVQFVESVDIWQHPGTRHAEVIARIALDRGEEVQLSFNYNAGSGPNRLMTVF